MAHLIKRGAFKEQEARADTRGTINNYIKLKNSSIAKSFLYDKVTLVFPDAA
jgi:hypothetical protein